MGKLLVKIRMYIRVILVDVLFFFLHSIYRWNSNQVACDQSRHFNYEFISKSNAAVGAAPYSCNNHPNVLKDKDLNCILPIADGVKACDSDYLCEGFMINTDSNWQEKFSKNGMQAVQLFGQGVTYTPSQTWRTFNKQH
jgi:hypothetical protein